MPYSLTCKEKLVFEKQAMIFFFIYGVEKL